MKEIHKAKMTANMAMVTDGNGIPSASTIITTTELNMLNNIRTNVQTQIDAKPDKTNAPGYPDLTACVSITAYPFTMPADGWLIVSFHQDASLGHDNIKLNDVAVAKVQAAYDFSYGSTSLNVPVKAGDVLTRSQKQYPNAGGFFPHKAQ